MSLADLTTEEVALFQMIEAGFVGVEHHITLLRAENSKFEKENNLHIRLLDILETSEAESYIDTGEAVDLLVKCKEYFDEHLPRKTVAVLAVYKRSIREGEFSIEPVARLLNDPSEVCNPVMEHTHEQRENGSADDQTPVAEGD